MKVARITPQAINRPLLILGIERMTLGVCLLLAYLIGALTNTVLGFLILFALCFIVRKASSKDPRRASVSLVLLRMKAAYDPIRREPFRMTIER